MYESTFIEIFKLKTPAIRGVHPFGHSVYYRGTTFTTDYHDGDEDWIMQDLDQVKLALK
jgi:hypothetical protein